MTREREYDVWDDDMDSIASSNIQPKRRMKKKDNHQRHDWDDERKPKRLEKGSDKLTKHRNSIYNMLSVDEDGFPDDEFDSDVNVRNNRYYVKR